MSGKENLTFGDEIVIGISCSDWGVTLDAVIVRALVEILTFPLFTTIVGNIRLFCVLSLLSVTSDPTGILIHLLIQKLRIMIG